MNKLVVLSELETISVVRLTDVGSKAVINAKVIASIDSYSTQRLSRPNSSDRRLSVDTVLTRVALSIGETITEDGEVFFVDYRHVNDVGSSFEEYIIEYRTKNTVYIVGHIGLSSLRNGRGGVILKTPDSKKIYSSSYKDFGDK